MKAIFKISMAIFVFASGCKHNDSANTEPESDVKSAPSSKVEIAKENCVKTAISNFIAKRVPLPDVVVEGDLTKCKDIMCYKFNAKDRAGNKFNGWVYYMTVPSNLKDVASGKDIAPTECKIRATLCGTFTTFQTRIYNQTNTIIYPTPANCAYQGSVSPFDL